MFDFGREDMIRETRYGWLQVPIVLVFALACAATLVLLFG